jgi:flagellar hook-length control protein FliK
VAAITVGGPTAAAGATDADDDALTIGDDKGAKPGDHAAPASTPDVGPTLPTQAGATGTTGTAAGSTAGADTLPDGAADAALLPTGRPANPASASDQLNVLPTAGTDPTIAATAALIAPSDDGGDARNHDVATGSADSPASTGMVVAAPTAGAAASATSDRTSNAASVAVPLSEVAVTIATQAQSGKSRFEIRLDPPDLGRIDVQLSVDSGGNVSSRIVAERPETLDLLRRDAPQLERALQNAGLNSGDGLQFSLSDQGFASRNGYASPDDYTAPASPATTEVTVPVAALQGYGALSGRSGGLDITV